MRSICPSYLCRTLHMQFNLNECFVKACDGKTFAIAPREGNLYGMNFKKVHIADATNLVSFSTKLLLNFYWTLVLWHRRLGYLNVNGVHTIQNKVSNMKHVKLSCPTSTLFATRVLKANNIGLCFQTRGRGNGATKHLEIMYEDVCCPKRTASTGGASYFVTFIDVFLRKSWLYMLKSKE